MPRSEYRSDYSPPRRSGTRVAEYEDIDIRRERHRPRERDYLRESYGREDDRDGVMILREDLDERTSVRGGRRDKEYREADEVIIARSQDKDRDRPRRREREYERDDSIELDVRRGGSRRMDPRDREEIDLRIERKDREIDEKRPRWQDRREERRGSREERPRGSRRSREYDQERIVDEWIYVPRERPVIAREVEEWKFEPRRKPSRQEAESVSVRERDRERDRPREEVRRETIDIREQERGPSSRYNEEEISIRERDRGSRSDYREEDVRISERERSGGYREEDIEIRERERERPREYRIEEIKITERERERPRESQEEEIKITERDRGGSSFRDEEIRIRERDRESDSRIGREEPRSNGSDYSRKDRRDDYEEEVIVKQKDREGPSGHSDEIIIIKRKERSPSPEPVPSLPPPRVRSPSPLPQQSPAKSTVEEIAITHKDSDGRHEDDIVIKRKGREESRSSPTGRSQSVDSKSIVSRRPTTQIEEEEDYYAKKISERAYIGEAYNGATKDWAIVDVPPGTSRVQMDGIGGASEEVTWQRYNGVRRSRFMPEGTREREPFREFETERRRYSGRRPRNNNMWTEITKDLVIKEALQKYGYEYEETEWFFYVMEYLRYKDVRRLVMASDEIRFRRRERIKEIEWESQMPWPPRQPLPERSWNEERIIEREWVGRGSPRPSLPPAPPAPPRIVEEDRVVTIRTER